MDQKEELQDEELKNVSGGSIDPMEGYTRCNKCYNTFYSRDSSIQSKNIKDGCSSYYVYQCPSCGAWVRNDGTVYSG